MKLTQVDLSMDWPRSIGVTNLRLFIIKNLTKRGNVIRWSIVDIQNSIGAQDTKKLFIHAVLLN